MSIGTGEQGADGRVPGGTVGRPADGVGTVPPFDALLPPDIARRAETVGVAKAAMRFDRLAVLCVLGGLVFSLGLILVVVAGAELFTGNTLVVIATASRRVRLGALLRSWLIVYVGNFVGALLTTLVIYWSGFYNGGGGAVGARALEIAATKTSLGFREAVLLGVLANALVCLAIWLAMSARSTTTTG